jgi:hypothetical protein
VITVSVQLRAVKAYGKVTGYMPVDKGSTYGTGIETVSRRRLVLIRSYIQGPNLRISLEGERRD